MVCDEMFKFNGRRAMTACYFCAWAPLDPGAAGLTRADGAGIPTEPTRDEDEGIEQTNPPELIRIRLVIESQGACD